MIEIKIENWDKLQKLNGSLVMTQALNATMRKSLMKTRTEISRNVRKVYNIKAGDIGKVVTLKKLSYTPPSYMLRYFGYRISLRRYGARPKRVKSTRGWRTGVTVRVRKDRGRKLVKGGFYGAGGWPVYMRTGTWRNGKEQIEKRSGLAIPQMVQGKDQLKLAHDFMGKELVKQFPAQMKFYLKRAAG